ncbi:hypothetical protein PHABIO_404 [Pseudomonas phage Phabio]|uniref:Uncharacterized protein n=1 Tax=Pseudomonas phage Phabio TaxID=2006668 RepID=A0A1Y0SX00_9CAUD|nr:hypothetical protein MZD05_gp404 [Pseudomonas phage Phabio]ARV77035.1 hypothetical protein PHABIO_404 [Pseudomonas phage Phabio]
MNKIDVIYSKSSGSGIRKSLLGFNTWVRTAPMVQESMTAIWIDADAGWIKDRDLIMPAIAHKLAEDGHDPFYFPHVIHQEPRKVVVDITSRELFFHKHSKEYHEKLSFGDEEKTHLYLKYDTNIPDASSSVEITDIWLIGNHYTVRKAKRYIANKLSNNNKYLTNNDLSRVKQLIGNGRVYMLSNIGRVIDLVNTRLVVAGGYIPTERELILTNSQIIHTGKLVERIHETSNLDNVLRSANGK